MTESACNIIIIIIIAIMSTQQTINNKSNFGIK